MGDYKLKSIFKADYVFLSGTAAEIQVVRKINKKRFKINSSIIDTLKDSYREVKILSPATTSQI